MMITRKTLQTLGTMDALSVSRDTLLRAMVIVPLVLAVAARWVFPSAIEQAGPLLPFDVQSVYPQFMSYVLLLLAPTICGMVVGFTLLDQRDDRTLTALQVTPLPLGVYLTYRLATPMLLSIAMTLVALPLSGQANLNIVELLVVSLATAPLAPIVALFLGAYAANKVQGFALQKALSVFFIAPCIGIIFPMPWRLLTGLVPTYWPVALLWGLQDGTYHAWFLLPVGLIYQIGLLVGLLRRFNRIVHE
jgi:fluoroquinolone transport system permease protein